MSRLKRLISRSTIVEAHQRSLWQAVIYLGAS